MKKTSKIAASLLAAALAGACVPAAALANATTDLEPAGDVIATSSVKAGDYSVTISANNRMFKPSEAVLHVGKNGAQVSFNHTTYQFVFLGTAAEYEAAVASGDVTKDPRYIAGVKTSSVASTGMLRTAYRFTFNVVNLNDPIDICVYSASKKELLDRKILVGCADAVKLPAAANLTVTASTAGKIAWEKNVDTSVDLVNTPLVARQVVAIDEDGDGKVSVAEAMRAAGAKYMADGSFFGKYAVAKGSKLAAKTAKSSKVAVKSGEALYAFTYKKASGKKADTFAAFSKTSVSVAAGKSVKLTLKGIEASKLAGKGKLKAIKGAKKITVSCIDAETGKVALPAKALAKNGTVSVKFAEAGTYVVTANGKTAAGSAITAPACVVSVSE